ncbi:MAG TPA: hypothetical protein VD906_07750, partial [Caulobacteraceae bacterium]|nr:hypothetical protein [Caulobacteraceae bacterium]
VWAPDGAGEGGFTHLNGAIDVTWKSGTRHAASAVLRLTDDYGQPWGEAVFRPAYEFLMLGLGYGHPKWAHGTSHGELAVEREDITLAEADPRVPHHLHVQALCDVTLTRDGAAQEGRGILEQLAIGPHAPSGFREMLDFAP